MKLHCRKHGDKELADEVNAVIANLQNLAKHGLVSAENGFNSVLKDIQLELEVFSPPHSITRFSFYLFALF